jgi:hypothetical protein
MLYHTMKNILRSNALSKYFKKLDYFDKEYIEQLNVELAKMINDPDGIHFHKTHNQICINTHKDFKTARFKGVRDYLIGTGSLIFDWNDDFKYRLSFLREHKAERILQKNHKDQRLLERDFNIVSKTFKGTIFEDLYEKLKQKHNIGRLRIMKMNPRNCLSWHQDTTPRLHIVLNSQKGNFMVIEDEIRHLPQYTCWITETTNNHTAFNSSKDMRIHIVAVLLDNPENNE